MSSHDNNYKQFSQNILTKPNLSYAALIAEAIICSPEKKLTLREIYFAINSRYPFFSLDKSGWKNSIRHNLSLNKAFNKMLKTNETSSDVKGSYWSISRQEAYAILNRGKQTTFLTREHSIPYNSQTSYGLMSQQLYGLNRMDGRDFGSFNRIDVRNVDDNIKEARGFSNNEDSQVFDNDFFRGNYEDY
ncbi:Forkhead box protein C2-B [Cucumispora dikerogammari]|nr:Forkhead box protein C2-B [Cucumispora dikerogammari]